MLSNKMHGNKGKRRTIDAKLKMSLLKLGAHRSEETKLKISNGLKGIQRSEETKLRISQSLKGSHWTLTQKTKNKMHEAAIKRMERQLKDGTVKWMDTDIEMLMYEGLLSRGYIIEKQKYIKGVVRVDFYLPEHNIIIECDGDYSHANPKYHDAEEMIYGKYKAKDKWLIDKIRTEKMQALGYKVLRFWGHDIKHNLQSCLEKINVG